MRTKRRSIRRSKKHTPEPSLTESSLALVGLIAIGEGRRPKYFVPERPREKVRQILKPEELETGMGVVLHLGKMVVKGEVTAIDERGFALRPYGGREAGFCSFISAGLLPVQAGKYRMWSRQNWIARLPDRPKGQGG